MPEDQAEHVVTWFDVVATVCSRLPPLSLFLPSKVHGLLWAWDQKAPMSQALFEMTDDSEVNSWLELAGLRGDVFCHSVGYFGQQGM